ncbi:hypothetical protein CEXT_129221 [Caerostris extrusa]|uniref:Ycf15 n=1 Tax=Caerostris extrusa TaxID=172846 RepID=A0AAV4XLU6_CAEEX|nr:hypothetical protein CEXT_129221 [Caerostris extrusa]
MHRPGDASPNFRRNVRKRNPAESWGFIFESGFICFFSTEGGFPLSKELRKEQSANSAVNSSRNQRSMYQLNDGVSSF